MVGKSREIANNATRLVAGEGLELFHEREVAHVLNNSRAVIKRVPLHKRGNIGEVIKILNNVVNVRMRLSAYIW